MVSPSLVVVGSWLRVPSPGLAFYLGTLSSCTPPPGCSCQGVWSQLWLSCVRGTGGLAGVGVPGTLDLSPMPSFVRAVGSLPETLAALTTFTERKVLHKMEWQLALQHGWDKSRLLAKIHLNQQSPLVQGLNDRPSESASENGRLTVAHFLHFRTPAPAP